MNDIDLSNTAFMNAFQKYQDILDQLLKHRCSDGLCRVSQTEIAKELKTSQSTVSQGLLKLSRSGGCIEKVGPGVYAVYHENAYKHGPFAAVMRYLKLTEKHPNLWDLPFKEQEKILSITPSELCMIRSYTHMLVTDLRKNCDHQSMESDQ